MNEIKIVYEYKIINDMLTQTNFHHVLNVSQIPTNDEPIYEKREIGVENIVGYKKNSWFSETLFQYPVLENDEVRESTLEELKLKKIVEVSEGEYIFENKLVIVQKPSELHSWDFLKNEWFLDVEKIKISKLPTKEELEESARLFQLAQDLEKLGV